MWTVIRLSEENTRECRFHKVSSVVIPGLKRRAHGISRKEAIVWHFLSPFLTQDRLVQTGKSVPPVEQVHCSPFWRWLGNYCPEIAPIFDSPHWLRHYDAYRGLSKRVLPNNLAWYCVMSMFIDQPSTWELRYSSLRKYNTEVYLQDALANIWSKI